MEQISSIKLVLFNIYQVRYFLRSFLLVLLVLVGFCLAECDLASSSIRTIQSLRASAEGRLFHLALQSNAREIYFSISI